MKRLAFSLVATAPLLAAQAPVPRADETSWYTIAAESGERIGYASREIVDTPEGRQVTDHSQIRVRDPGDPIRRITERSVTRLDRSGRVVSISNVSRMGLIESTIEVRNLGDVVEIVRIARRDRRMLRVPLPPGTRFDGGEGLLPGWDMRATPRLEFFNFNIAAMAPERVVIEPLNEPAAVICMVSAPPTCVASSVRLGVDWLV